MSRTNWRSSIALKVGLATFLTGLAFFSLPKQFQQPGDTERSDSRAKQYARHVLHGVNDAGAPIIGGQEAAPSDPKAERNEWRQEEDPKAQRQQADWARYAVFAAIASAFATALGVWLVKLTLDATRAALGEAERSSNAAVAMARAMVGIELPVIQARWMGVDLTAVSEPIAPGEPYGGHDLRDLPGVHSVLGDIPFRNYGRTPAFLLSISLGFAVIDRLPANPIFTRQITLDSDTIIKPEPREEPLSVEVSFGIDLGKEQIQALRAGTADLWVYFALFYADFMKQSHEDRFCARWAQRPKGLGVHHFASDGDPPPAYTRRT